MLEKCCPVFDSKPWHDVLFKWEDKRFIKGEVKTFFYIPFGFGKTMTKLVAEAEKFDAKTEAMISLSNHLSKWKMLFCVVIFIVAFMKEILRKWAVG